MLAVGICDLTRREIFLFIADLSLAQNMKAYKGNIHPFIRKEEI
jgi:hypothetical protein